VVKRGLKRKVEKKSLDGALARNGEGTRDVSCEIMS